MNLPGLLFIVFALPGFVSAVIVSISPPHTFTDEHASARLTCSTPKNDPFVACVWFSPEGRTCTEKTACDQNSAVSENTTSCSIDIAKVSYRFKGTWTCMIFTVRDYETKEISEAETQIYFVTASTAPHVSGMPEEDIVFADGVEVRTESILCTLENPSPLTRNVANNHFDAF
jgi:hypothetical protein